MVRCLQKQGHSVLVSLKQNKEMVFPYSSHNFGDHWYAGELALWLYSLRRIFPAVSKSTCPIPDSWSSFPFISLALLCLLFLFLCILFLWHLQFYCLRGDSKVANTTSLQSTLSLKMFQSEVAWEKDIDGEKPDPGYRSSVIWRSRNDKAISTDASLKNSDHFLYFVSSFLAFPIFGTAHYVE